MTIKYHSGRRIQGLAKVGGATYTPTIETAKWALTDNGGSATIANNALTIVNNSNGDNPIATYDLGATLSDTKWLMTFQVVYSGFQNSASGQGTKMGIGISSTSATSDLDGWSPSGTSFMEYAFMGHASTSVWQTNTGGGNSSGASEQAGSNYADGGGYSATHYVKLYRLTSTTGKMEFYLQSDYSGTAIESLNVTYSNAPSGLRYVFVRSEYENVPDTNTFVISNFQIYNDSITVLPITTVGDTKPTSPAIVDTTSVSGSTIITFKESTSFTPTSSYNIEYLVIAGGAGGGGCLNNTTGSAGGGAGGYRTATGFGVTAQTYQITVGSGGAGGIGKGLSVPTNGSNGGNSIFGSITSIGGGGGGHGGLAGAAGGGAGSTGGSGGGSGRLESGAAGTSGQGNTGGDGSVNAFYAGGGGGGSSAVGSNAVSGGSGYGTGGAGGAGTSSSITGNAVIRTGGGGGAGHYAGGAGGTGGGGAGANNAGGADGSSALTNSGSGGGGCHYLGAHNGGNGGSGIVILKIPNGSGYELSSPQLTSRYEETNTRKIYYKDDIDWKELDGAEATNYTSESWFEQLSGETP